MRAHMHTHTHVCAVVFALMCIVHTHHTIPYRTIPYRTIPYHTIPYHTIPYRVCVCARACVRVSISIHVLIRLAGTCTYWIEQRLRKYTCSCCGNGATIQYCKVQYHTIDWQRTGHGIRISSGHWSAVSCGEPGLETSAWQNAHILTGGTLSKSTTNGRKSKTKLQSCCLSRVWQLWRTLWSCLLDRVIGRAFNHLTPKTGRPYKSTKPT